MLLIINLLHVEKEALEVGAFGVEEGDGVVVGLAVALEDADGAARFVGGAEEDVLEEGLIDVVGAGTGEEEAA